MNKICKVISVIEAKWNSALKEDFNAERKHSKSFFFTKMVEMVCVGDTTLSNNEIYQVRWQHF